MTFFKEDFSVPKEWRRVLNELLDALTKDPALSAIRYIIDHKNDKSVLDLLVAKQFIKHDPLEDYFSLHLMGLLTADSACAQGWKRDVESIFSQLNTHFTNHPKSPITIKELSRTFDQDDSRFLTCVRYVIDMGIFSRSAQLTEENAWIQPTPAILDFENVQSIWQTQGPVWFAEMRSGEQKFKGDRDTESSQKNNLGNEKSRREQRLKWFLAEIDHRALLFGFTWTSKSIPATKEQFKDLFFRINSDLSPRSESTLGDQAKKLGACFQPGTSQKEATELHALFQEELDEAME